MSLNIPSIVSSSDYLKYQPIKDLVNQVMDKPGETTVKLPPGVLDLTKNPRARTDRILLFIEKIFHNIKCFFSSSYKQRFLAAANKVKQAVKEEFAAVKIQKTAKGFLARKDFKQMKVDKSKAEEVKKQIEELKLQQEAEKAKQAELEKAQKEEELKKKVLAAKQESSAKKIQNTFKKWKARNEFLNKEHDKILQKITYMGDLVACHALQGKVENLTKAIAVKKAAEPKAPLSIPALPKDEGLLTKIGNFFKNKDNKPKALLPPPPPPAPEDLKLAAEKQSLETQLAAIQDKIKQANPKIDMSQLSKEVAKEEIEIKAMQDKFNQMMALNNNLKKFFAKNPLTLPEKKTDAPEIPGKPENPPLSSSVTPSPQIGTPSVQLPQSSQTEQKTPAQTIQKAPVQEEPNKSQKISAQAVSQKQNSQKEHFLQDLGNRIHPDMRAIFEGLLSNFGGGMVKSWECKPDGSYRLELAKQIKIWVPGDKNDPTVGGSVLIFGYSEKKPYIEGTLDKKNKIMNFSDGFIVHCVHQTWGAVAPNVYSMGYKNENDVAFTAGKFIKKDTKSKTVSEFRHAWAKAAVIVPPNVNDYDFIAKKG